MDKTRTDSPASLTSRVAWLGGACALALFLALSIGYSFTRSPWWDEGVFADIAINFRNSFHLKSSVLAPHSFLDLPGIDRYTYWILPFFPIALGTWLHIVPITIESVRSFSVLWGCVFGISWFLFVRAITRNVTLALLVSSAVILDFSVIWAASDARMDMMTAALGQTGLATYVCLKDQRRRWALFLGGVCCAAAVFSHPMGIIPTGCFAVVLLFDWPSVRTSGLAVAALPFIIATCLCLIYISQAPDIFAVQSQAAFKFRLVEGPSHVQRVLTDFSVRYLGFYFTRLTGLSRLKGCSLLFGVAGAVALAINRRLRSTTLRRILLLEAAIAYVAVALIDNQGFFYYLVYPMPVLTACGALWTYETFTSRSRLRFLSALLFAGAVVATTLGFIHNIARDDFRTRYGAAVAAIRQNAGPGELVMGPSELGFSFGFHRPLVDDCYLGYLSGLEPRVYVWHNACGPGPLPRTRAGWNWMRQTLKSKYRMVLSNEMYSVFVKEAD